MLIVNMSCHSQVLWFTAHENASPVKSQLFRTTPWRRLKWCLEWDVRAGQENAVKLPIKQRVVLKLKNLEQPHARVVGTACGCKTGVYMWCASGWFTCSDRADGWLQLWAFPLPRMQSAQEDVLGKGTKTRNSIKGCWQVGWKPV